MTKFWLKRQVYNKGILPILDIFSQYETMISLECAVDAELNDVIAFVVSCSVSELIIHRNHKNQAFNDPNPQLNLLSTFSLSKCACVVVFKTY